MKREIESGDVVVSSIPSDNRIEWIVNYTENNGELLVCRMRGDKSITKVYQQKDVVVVE